MSDTFPCTLNRVQWHTIAHLLSFFSTPESTQLQVQINAGLRRPRADSASRFRMLVSCMDGELFLVPDGFENEFRQKDLDNEPLHDYYSWVNRMEDLSFTDPVERQP